MRTIRILLKDTLASGEIIDVDATTAHHLLTVLRVSTGQNLIVFDGNGHSARAEVHDATKQKLSVRILEPLDEHPESPLYTHVGLAVSKGERMDFAVQKLVEMGATEISPLFTEFTVVKLDLQRQTKRLAHWQKIIENACEQCGRNQLPRLNPVSALAQWLQQTHKLGIYFDAHAQTELASIQPQPDRISIIIGPEGGLSDKEIVAARQAGFIGIQLGPRIMRTETAAIACLSALQVYWGDLG